MRARNKHKKTLDYIEKENEMLRQEIAILKYRLSLNEGRLAEQEAEIARLTYLLEHQAKRR